MRPPLSIECAFELGTRAFCTHSTLMSRPACAFTSGFILAHAQKKIAWVCVAVGFGGFNFIQLICTQLNFDSGNFQDVSIYGQTKKPRTFRSQPQKSRVKNLCDMPQRNDQNPFSCAVCGVRWVCGVHMCELLTGVKALTSVKSSIESHACMTPVHVPRKKRSIDQPAPLSTL